MLSFATLRFDRRHDLDLLDQLGDRHHLVLLNLGFKSDLRERAADTPVRRNRIEDVFEKRPNDYLQTSPHGAAFRCWSAKAKLEVVYLRPLDLSIDETLLELRDAVKRIGAKARGHRFAVRPRAGSRADVPERTSANPSIDCWEPSPASASP